MASDPTYSTFMLEKQEPEHGFQWFRGQVPNGLSGVDAGTYGDELTVGQFTVNALGVITKAVRVPIKFPTPPPPGGGSNTVITDSGVIVSGSMDIPNVGDSVGFTHGLGAAPSFFGFMLIFTIPNTAGYNVGDLLNFGSIYDTPFAMFANDTACGVRRRLSALTMSVSNGLTGADVVLDETTIKIIGYAGL